MTLEQKIERIKKYVGTGPVVAPASARAGGREQQAKKKPPVGKREQEARRLREEAQESSRA